MLLLLLYAILLLLFRFVRIRKSKNMPPVLAYSIAEADPVCVARTLLYHTHALTPSEALLLVSRSPELLLSHNWSLFADFGMLQYIANLCWQPKPVRTLKLSEPVEEIVQTDQVDAEKHIDAVEDTVEPAVEPVETVEPTVELTVEPVEPKPRKKSRTSKSTKA